MSGTTRERVYRFVRGRLLEGRPPTVREVKEHFGFRAVQTAHEHLQRLVAEGRLEKDAGIARGYRLPGRGARALFLVPVLGRVAAGELSTAVEDLEGYVPVEGAGEDFFALRVRGESMRDAGILDGDLVLVQKQATARDGEIVVALVDDEATVKHLHKKGKRVELRPANPSFRPIAVDPRELRVLGKVVEVRRRLA